MISDFTKNTSKENTFTKNTSNRNTVKCTLRKSYIMPTKIWKESIIFPLPPIETHPNSLFIVNNFRVHSFCDLAIHHGLLKFFIKKNVALAKCFKLAQLSFKETAFHNGWCRWVIKQQEHSMQWVCYLSEVQNSMLIVVFERFYFYQTLVKSKRGKISENFINIGERPNGVYFANPCWTQSPYLCL